MWFGLQFLVDLAVHTEKHSALQPPSKLPVLYVQYIFMSNTAAAEFCRSAENKSVNKN